jgi:hypothetical protein
MYTDIRNVGESLCRSFDTYMHFPSLGDLNRLEHPVKAKLSHTGTVFVAIVKNHANDGFVTGSLVDA